MLLRIGLGHTIKISRKKVTTRILIIIIKEIKVRAALKKDKITLKRRL